MRKQSLRQAANQYLKTDNRGSFKDKKHRAFVIHKLIDDLFAMGEIPSSWDSLKTHHITKLVQHWQKHKIKPATMMDYMTTIRAFLESINYSLTNIDNKSLGLNRHYKSHQNNAIRSDIWTTFSEPVVRLIMAMQTQFGLTFNEALNLTPDIHSREHRLWITREIAFNSTDRMIPLRTENQNQLINELINYSSGYKSLVQLHHYNDIRLLWRMALISQNLPINRTYRYLYAQQLYKELSPILGNYQTSWLIRDEMGIKSRNTLWLYLNE